MEFYNVGGGGWGFSVLKLISMAFKGKEGNGNGDLIGWLGFVVGFYIFFVSLGFDMGGGGLTN